MIDPERIHVLHVVLSLDVGGLERIVVDLMREGQTLGQHVSVLCLERAGELGGHADAMGVKLLCANKPPGKRPGLTRSLTKTLRQIAPDVVHTHQITPLFYVGPAARRAGTPLVVHTEHGKNYAKRWRTRILGRIASRHAERFFCVSQNIADEVLGSRIAAGGKIEVIANGIDPTRFSRRDQRDGLRRSLDIPQEAPVIGTVGRLSDVKRQDLLIRAFAVARRSDPRMHLVLVGDGPRAADLQALSERMNLERVVHFVGYQAQPEKYLQIMDLFALTSESEGMPLAVLEAWAAGLPVVGSRVGGIPELIKHGENGMLFESGDERALAALFTSLTRDRVIAATLGAAGRVAVRARYHIRRTAQAYHQQYMQLLAAKGPVIST